MAEIGIVDTRSILKLVLEKSGWDFGEYSITFLKRRLEYYLDMQGFQNAETLKRKLEFDKGFLDSFLVDFIPSTTEMFRDPSLWRCLKESILPEIKNSTTPPKIWVASFDSGEELYTLAIALKELNLLGKVKIFASEYSAEVTKRIKEGVIDAKKMEINEANYQRFQGKTTFESYFKTSKEGVLHVVSELVKDVTFVSQNASFTNVVSGCRLILFRNQLIYMNISLEEKVVIRMRDSLIAGGFLVVGIKENLEHLSAGSGFININSTEKIYKRKIG